MTTNRECVVAALEQHRLGGAWNPEAVADDVIAQLGLKPDSDAKNAKPIVDPNALSEDEVRAAEAQAKEAQDKAKAVREQFNAQQREANQAEREAARGQQSR